MNTKKMEVINRGDFVVIKRDSSVVVITQDYVDIADNGKKIRINNDGLLVNKYKPRRRQDMSWIDFNIMNDAIRKIMRK